MPPSATDHVDVLIVGAGISGIGAAHHLQQRRPGTTYAILERRGAIGGTWDLFRYPGVRSDSDLHTFGYAFKPWTDDKAIADGPAIRAYVEEVATESGIEDRIRFHHRVLGAEWSTEDARWTVEAERTDTGERVALTARWLFSAGGYYRYDEGYTPHFEGRERFRGTVLHPQHWPEDLDYTDKEVVVVGSGATAVTLVPALTDKARHVTMLQRSPTYVLPLPAEDAVGNFLRRHLGEERAYDLIRRKNVRRQALLYTLSRRHPRLVRRVIRAVNAKQLPGIDVDTHFNPEYDPWDQRLCAVPDGDLFRALRVGKASVVTDRIRTFTERGIELESGTVLEADVIVTATGLNLQAFGGMDLAVDGRPVSLPETFAYKGMMLSGVPNFAFAVGYTNASWTLKVDLVCEYLCRLIGHLDAIGHDAVVPEVDDPEMEERPLLDFAAGYVQRSLHQWPKQGASEPWTLNMSYAKDVEMFRKGRLDDGVRFFSATREREPALAA